MGMEAHLDRPLPRWYDDAKFGIFVHWFPASVPAFAPVGPDPFALAEEHGWAYSFAHSPYAEWYQNSLGLDGSPVQRHHAERYGDQPYAAFVEQFLAGLDRWDPEPWADLFAASGAGYVVLGTKHHDGALLWPSAHPNPHRSGWQAERDVVGELAAAVRARGLRFGLYYSGGLDWTFGGLPIDGIDAMIRAIPQGDDYVGYCRSHWEELIERYQPSVLWNDIASPGGLDLAELFDRYYAVVPDGVVNDRFDLLGVHAGTVHADFVTPEYSSSVAAGRKWELCRGLGTSFGFNRAESDSDYLAPGEVIGLLVDVVGRGGNLLLNVGPAADGTIPAAQADRLLAAGWWLRANEEAVMGTHPWSAAPGGDGEGRAEPTVRWTTDGEAIFALLTGLDVGGPIDLPGVSLTAGTTVELVTRSGPVEWSETATGIRVAPPFGTPPVAAVALRLSPAAGVTARRPSP